MDDRLKDLKVPLTAKYTPNEADVEGGEQSENPVLKEFLKELEKCGQGISSIRTCTDNINKYRKELGKTANPTSEKKKFDEIDAISKNAKKYIDKIKKALGEMKKNLGLNKDLDDQDRKIIGKKIIYQIDNLKVSVQEFKTAQMDCKMEFDKKIQRQFEIVTQDEEYSKKEIKEIMEDPAQMQDIIQKKMTGTASLKLANVVRDIEEKLQDIEILADNIHVLTELLEDLNMLVKEQGVMIDEVGQNIQDAGAKADKGLTNLQEAKEQNDKYNKRQWWFCCCIIMLLIVIGSPILITVLIRSGIF